MLVNVAKRQRFSVVELIVHARVDRNAALRRLGRVGEGADHAQSLRVESDRVDDGAVVNRVPPDVQKERRPFVERAAQIPAVLLQQERRLLLRVRIARIPEIMSEVVEPRSAKLVGPRLGEDLNAAQTKLIVFWRERILVDANLAN